MRRFTYQGEEKINEQKKHSCSGLAVSAQGLEACSRLVDDYLMNMEMELLLASALICICIKRSQKKKKTPRREKENLKTGCGRLLCHLRDVSAYSRIIGDTFCRALKHLAV